SYIDQVRQSRRTEAISLLMRAANEQEQYFSIEQEYATKMEYLDLPDETESDWYTVSVTAADDTGFTITATAQGDQQSDDCDTLYIDETGSRWANSDERSPDTAISKE